MTFQDVPCLLFGMWITAICVNLYVARYFRVSPTWPLLVGAVFGPLGTIIFLLKLIQATKE